MGGKNVLNVFFKIENGKHVGSCNVQCLNAAVYKKFVKKILNYSVNMWNSPHTLRV